MLTKDKVLDSINNMPDNFTIDELIDRLVFIEKVERGLEQSKRGEVYPHEEVKKMLNR